VVSARQSAISNLQSGMLNGLLPEVRCLVPSQDSRLERGSQVFPGQVAVAQYLGKQAGADGFAPVNRNNGASAVRVTEEVMAAFDPNQREALLAQGLDQTFARERRKVAQTATVTRWTPTNLLVTGSSTSRQSAMASCTRFIRASRDLACV
jgi:hypothetical protein